ncbi:GTPase [Glutamicibacter sp. BSL13]
MSERKRQRAASNLTEQINALNQALELGGDFMDPVHYQESQAVLDKAAARRELSAEHTVIGLFGATGSGKSSLFNALVGKDIALTGVVRPTTRAAVAAVWKPENAAELLDWLQVPERHSMSEPLQGAASSRKAAHTSGLLLLDLPDMDSTSVEHHQIAARLAGQVDFLIWVLDPQKYADASIHHGYLSSLGAQAGNLMVVLNQIDTLSPSDREDVLVSLKSLLRDQGLKDVSVVVASTLTGEGVEEVRSQIVTVMRRHELATQRIRNDVDAIARQLEEELPASRVSLPGKSSQQQLERSVAAAHGTERIADAVGTSYRLRAAKSTGWPLTSWLTRLRNDPLQRMNLGRNEKPSDLSLTSRPELSAGEVAAVDRAVDGYVHQATEPMPPSWRQPLLDDMAEAGERMEGPIDLAIASTPLGVEKGSWWWPLIKILQWVSVVLAAAGALWLGALAAAQFMQFSLPEPPRIEGIAIPTLLLLGGILVGIVLGLGGSIFNRLLARIKRKKALGNLNKSVAQVVRQEVVDPTGEHVDRYNSFAGMIRQAAKRVQ